MEQIAQHGRFTDATSVTSRQVDMATTAFGVWLILGLFVDGWAHLNRPGLESFFTPWHAVLYSGFTAAAAWLAVLGLRRWRQGRRGPDVLPAGYRLGAVGVALFGLGGLGDMAWHVAFGVEVGIDALLSPTHLLLLAGAVLLLSTAWRATWSRPTSTPPRLRTELPAVLSMTLVTAAAAFFLLYVSVFTSSAAAVPLTRIPEGAPGHEAAELLAAAGLAGYVVTTVLLVVPLLMFDRRGRRPVGAAFILVSAVSWLSAMVASSADALAAAAGTTVAAALLEVALVHHTRRATRREPLHTIITAALVPAFLWPAQLISVAIVDELRWPPTLSLGVVVLTALVAAALGLLAAWPDRDETLVLVR